MNLTLYCLMYRYNLVHPVEAAIRYARGWDLWPRPCPSNCAQSQEDSR